MGVLSCFLAFMTINFMNLTSSFTIYHSISPNLRKTMLKMQERKWSSSRGTGVGYDRSGRRDDKQKSQDWANRSNMSRNRRNDPWWMRDEEKNNPRVLPEYIPWWAQDIPAVSDSWTVAQLTKEASRRGLAVSKSAKKREIIDLLAESTSSTSLSDDNFLYPSYIEAGKQQEPCYPEVYEGIERIKALEKIAFQVRAPGTE